jgi:hypothetical protein
MKPRTLHALALGTTVLLGVYAQGATGVGRQAGGAEKTGQTTTETSANAPKLATSQAAEQIPGSKVTLSDFAWLTGNWQGAWGPRIVEETWMAPKAGEMVGIFRVLENDKTLVIELLSLLETPDGIEFRFRHFTPPLVTWEQAGPTALILASFDSKTAVFENAGTGQPKRGTLTRVDPDTYISRSEIIPQGNNAQVTEIKFHRQNAAAAPLAGKKASGGSKAKQ